MQEITRSMEAVYRALRAAFADHGGRVFVNVQSAPDGEQIADQFPSAVYAVADISTSGTLRAPMVVSRVGVSVEVRDLTSLGCEQLMESFVDALRAAGHLIGLTSASSGYELELGVHKLRVIVLLSTPA